MNCSLQEPIIQRGKVQQYLYCIIEILANFVPENCPVIIFFSTISFFLPACFIFAAVHLFLLL